MKIVLASAPVKTRDIDFNVRSMVSVMKKFSGEAELILFGESVLQGFDCLCWEYERDKRVAVGLNDDVIKQLREQARVNEIAVSFGFIERADDALFSSQLFIDNKGEIIDHFRRVSQGWKEYWKTDDRYREGNGFNKLSYSEKTFSTGLCGDLWTENRPEEINALNADIVLWPVWCDYSPNEWNNTIKHDYARQAALCGSKVLLVNPFCADENVTDVASGGAVFFKDGTIADEMPAGQTGCLVVEV